MALWRASSDGNMSPSRRIQLSSSCGFCCATFELLLTVMTGAPPLILVVGRGATAADMFSADPPWTTTTTRRPRADERAEVPSNCPQWWWSLHLAGFRLCFLNLDVWEEGWRELEETETTELSHLASPLRLRRSFLCGSGWPDHSSVLLLCCSCVLHCSVQKLVLSLPFHASYAQEANLCPLSIPRAAGAGPAQRPLLSGARLRYNSSSQL